MTTLSTPSTFNSMPALNYPEPEILDGSYMQHVENFRRLRIEINTVREIDRVVSIFREMVETTLCMRAIGDRARRFALYLKQDDDYEQYVEALNDLAHEFSLPYPTLPHKPLPEGE